MKRLALLLLTAFAVCACQTSRQASPARPKIVGPGTLISITVEEDRSLALRVVVSADGTIEFQPLGRLVVEGLTANETASKIEEDLERDYFTNATVSVKVIERPYGGEAVYVEGEVEKVGAYPWRPGMTIGDALDAARFTPRFTEAGPWPNNVEIVSTTDTSRFRIRLKATTPLEWQAIRAKPIDRGDLIRVYAGYICSF